MSNRWTINRPSNREREREGRGRVRCRVLKRKHCRTKTVIGIVVAGRKVERRGSLLYLYIGSLVEVRIAVDDKYSDNNAANQLNRFSPLFSVASLLHCFFLLLVLLVAALFWCTSLLLFVLN